MDINLLVLNLGNTRLAMGAFVAGELKGVRRIGNDRTNDWSAAIEQTWALIAGRPGAAVAAASVNPPLEQTLEQAIARITCQPVQWIGRQIDLPIEVLTENPAQTGVDRILNVAAAYEQMQKACVVVDAGSAITVDCCNDKGQFLGGAIAPGAAMMLAALHRHTAALPLADLQVPSGAFGRSTIAAIQCGVYHGIRGMVRELVEGFATELHAWPEVIATGGDAPLLFDKWELVHAVAPDLTLYGVALAYAEHHIRHGT